MNRRKMMISTLLSEKYEKKPVGKRAFFKCRKQNEKCKMGEQEHNQDKYLHIVSKVSLGQG